jgi:hypothetical protein
MYKLADKLNMTELKCRAFEHIVQSLSIESIPYEVFSAFSEQFPEVRKVQIDMMLHYWVSLSKFLLPLLPTGPRACSHFDTPHIRTMFEKDKL